MRPRRAIWRFSPSSSQGRRTWTSTAAGDGSISVAEEEEIRVVSRALLLDDAVYLAVRSRCRDRRAVA